VSAVPPRLAPEVIECENRAEASDRTHARHRRLLIPPERRLSLFRSEALVSDVLELQAFLRASAATGRELVRIPPFTATFTPDEPLKYLNYAVPDDEAEPDADAIALLREAFSARGRLPRLEWVEEAAPSVAAALAAAEMTEELRTPLMACAPEELAEPHVDVERLTVEPVEPGDLREASNLQRAAFDQPPLGADEEPGMPSGGTVLARSGGMPVSAAAWTPVIDGVSEVAGVATAEEWRRRGLAGVVTAAAARAAFAAGASLCVLSPGNDTAQRVYARAGFRRVATMLHWSDPDGG
jgi:ribosomal protein S18 acetylase RimI-like enzyme